MGRILDRISYARSLCITAPLIFIYTGVMGSLSVASSLIDSTGRIQHGCARVWAKMILWTSGIHLKVSGVDRLQPDAGYVFCVNHQSHMDIPIILAALPFQFRFAAKKELFRIPFLGWHMHRSGYIPIDRENPRAAVKSLRAAGERIRNGTRLVIFPEGGTSLDGSIKPFKGGGFMVATQGAVDVVAVTIRGSRSVLAPKTHHIRGGRVEVTLGSPVSPAGSSPGELATRVHDEILATFKNGKTLDRYSYSVSR